MTLILTLCRTALLLGQSPDPAILDARWRLRPDGYVEGVHVEQLRYYTALRIMSNQMLRECDQDRRSLESENAHLRLGIDAKDRVIDTLDRKMGECYDANDALRIENMELSEKSKRRGRLWWIIAGETVALAALTYTIIK